MNIGDLERWVDFSTPIDGVVNNDFNSMEKWVDYSTPPLIFSDITGSIFMPKIIFFE